MSKFSEGTWKLNSYNDIVIRYDTKSGEYPVWYPDKDYPNKKADALIMRAAPVMYEALKTLYELNARGAFTLEDKDYIAITKAAAALAEAEGEERG